jgi:RNA-binding protein YhbY
MNLTPFLREIKKATDKGAADALLQEANERVARVVIRGAQALARTKQQRKAAATLETSSSRMAVKVVGGGKGVPYFGGANFNARINETRLIKAPNVRGTRARATLVRSGENIDKVARRVESQYVDSRGRNIGRRAGGTQVTLSRTKAGGLRSIKGWNNFTAKGQPPVAWVKNKDNFVYASVTMNYDAIAASYQRFIDDNLGDAFPD